MSIKWYALRSQSQKEHLLHHQVLIHGIECFYPRLKIRPVNPRARKVKPYFPGYMFIQTDLEQTGLSLFQWMPYAIGLVCFGGEPAVVPDGLINAIEKKLEEASALEQEMHTFHTGDAITIHNGPFAGYEAVFDTCISGNERVRVLLKMLNQRNLPVELDVDQISRRRPKK